MTTEDKIRSFATMYSGWYYKYGTIATPSGIVIRDALLLLAALKEAVPSGTTYAFPGIYGEIQVGVIVRPDAEWVRDGCPNYPLQSQPSPLPDGAPDLMISVVRENDDSVSISTEKEGKMLPYLNNLTIEEALLVLREIKSEQ